MAQPPAEPGSPKPTSPAKGSVAARVTINRRLEAGDELFDRVLGRLERFERRRRRRRWLLYALVWLAIVGLIAASVHYGWRNLPSLNLPFFDAGPGTDKKMPPEAARMALEMDSKRDA